LKHGVSVLLSAQQIVSCDTAFGDLGCSGGWPMGAYQYVVSAGGIDSESAYPYTSGASGSTGSCRFNSTGIAARISGYTYATNPCTDTCTKQDEATLLNNLGATGPVSVCVNAASWQFYTGGVLSASCAGAYTQLDHCVQLTGYTSTASANYWVVRNQWGASWGNTGTDAGYIYIKYGSNLCGIADQATFATAV